MKAKLLFTHAISPLHPGTGQGTGVIDLPIAREVATGIPYLPGSSLKGVLRDRCEQDEANNCADLFGPATKDITNSNNSKAGALQFTDQRLLALPVRSLSGTFAWVISPFILQRFKRTLGYVDDVSNAPDIDIPQPGKKEAYTAVSSAILLKNQVILEDLDFTAVADNAATTKWAEWLAQRLFPKDAKGEGWRKTFTERFCVLHDDTFSFLMETATEVIARNVLDENKTSKNLWYEEALPAETILVGLMTAQSVGKNGMGQSAALKAGSKLTQKLTQLGGNATVGRGLCRLVTA